MLDKIEVDIKDHYYDPQLHGLDLDKRFESARQKIATAQSQNEALLQVAGAVAALSDSHTRFLNLHLRHTESSTVGLCKQ
jgi:hypothetical protein